MSLSSQLSRGFLALPFLALMAGLALAGQAPARSSSDAGPVPTLVRASRALASVALPCAAEAGRGPVLRLALAPADLGAGSRLRAARDCRA